MLDRRKMLAAGLAAATLAPPLRAQTLAVAKVLMGAPAGGAGDSFLRKLADKMKGGYAGSVIVENKPGAGGQIALMAVRDAAPDGSTLLMTPSTFFSVYPHTYAKLPYDPHTDFTPISLLSCINFGLAVGPAVPASVTNLRELVAWAKANPDKATYGSPAPGSVPHLIVAAAAKRAAAHVLDARHRPLVRNVAQRRAELRDDRRRQRRVESRCGWWSDSAAALVPPLPPGLEHRHRDRVAQVQAALAGAHRQAQALRRCERLAQRCRQARGFAAEDQPVAALPRDIGERALGARGEGEASRRVRPGAADERLPRRVPSHARVLVIVQPGALQLLVVHREAERFDQVQRAAGVGGQPDHVAGVRRDLGVDEDDVEHRLLMRCARRPTAAPTRRRRHAACAPLRRRWRRWS
jgi:hypothetical protein